MMKIIYKTELLKERMAHRGWSPAMVAKKAGVHSQTVTGILERGGGHQRKVCAVARALGFPVDLDDMSALFPRIVEEIKKSA